MQATRFNGIKSYILYLLLLQLLLLLLLLLLLMPFYSPCTGKPVLARKGQQYQFFSMSEQCSTVGRWPTSHRRWKICTGCPSSSASSTRCALWCTWCTLASAYHIWQIPWCRQLSVTVALAFVRAAHNDISNHAFVPSSAIAVSHQMDPVSTAFSLPTSTISLILKNSANVPLNRTCYHATLC